MLSSQATTRPEITPRRNPQALRTRPDAGSDAGSGALGPHRRARADPFQVVLCRLRAVGGWSGNRALAQVLGTPSGASAAPATSSVKPEELPWRDVVKV